MLRVASLVLAGSLVNTATHANTVQMGPALALAPAETVESLHRAGEEHFDVGDYAEARAAWVGAYARVESAEETWPYRATLLSLIVTTTLAEFSVAGDREPVREVAGMLDEALEADLDLEIRASLTEERERLTPYLDPPPSPAEAPPPEDLEPIEEEDTRKQLVPDAVWIGGGAALLVGGLAAVIAGSRFVPRAEDQVQDAGDSTSMPPGSTFIDDERAKGTGWMAAGGVVAAAGATALIIGIVRIVKKKR